MMNIILFVFGAVSYGLIELMWRGHTHWTMLLAGGTAFMLIQLINRKLSPHMHYLTVCVIGGLAVTAVELIFGAVVNLWLGWNVWDYSGMPMNLWGQICLPFSLLWVALMIAVINLEKQIRFKMFGDV